VNVQVRYSDALATADLSRAELLHPVDGWHASAEGHNVLAEAAFSDLQPSLEFLGIKSSPSDSRN
jgi:lysophospholipase L1-like esterase